MNRHSGRLLFILLIGAWLIGLASTGALAGITLSCGPGEATANSVWNWVAIWTDGDGQIPHLNPGGGTGSGGAPGGGGDGSAIEYGYDGGWANQTVGSIRGFRRESVGLVPAEWADGMTWWPVAVEPDGFTDFVEPSDVTEQLVDSKGMSLEVYQPVGYAAIQPAPQPAATDNKGRAIDEASGDAWFDHGLDFIRGTDAIPVQAQPAPPAALEVPAPNADGTLAQQVITEREAIAGNEADGVLARPATPAVIVTARVPLLLVGVWSDAQRRSPIRARISNANDIYPASTDEGARNPAGWPKYNVIEIMEEDGKLPSSVTEVYVSYYAPGTHYVITEQTPLPLPYTVYKVPIIDAAVDQFVQFNDRIAHLDPQRVADPADPATVNADLNNFDLDENTPGSLPHQCGIMGIYLTPKLDADDLTDPAKYGNDDPTNYFDLSKFAAGATRYEVAGGRARAYFSTPLPASVRTAKSTQYMYIKVSTNAVEGVWTSAEHGPADTNYYLRSASSPDAGKPIGYSARGGIIRLGTPLPDPEINAAVGAPVRGAACWVRYRRLSNNRLIVGETPNIAYVSAVRDLKPKPSPDYVFKPETQVREPFLGSFLVGDPVLPFGTYAAGVIYDRRFESAGGAGSGGAGNGGAASQGPVVYLYSSTGQQIPMNYIQGDAISGMEFRVSVSTGLNMSNPLQWPNRVDAVRNDPTLNNKLIYDRYGYPMYYVNDLHTDTWPAPVVRRYWAAGKGVKDNKPFTYEVKDIPVTVHDSSFKRGTIDYGGAGTLDSLSIISDASQPSNTNVDPLSVEVVEDANPAAQDDGSSSTHFIFRVRYHNENGLQPLPWLHESDDVWNTYGGGSNTGVVLYLDEKGTGDYRPHFMRRENPELASDPKNVGDVYMLRIMPRHSGGVTGPWGTAGNMFPVFGGPYPASPAPNFMTINGEIENNRLYKSLACGTYHYFFACSDDSLTFDNGTFVFENQNSGPMNPDDPTSKSGRAEWGETGGLMSSSGLDPSAQRTVLGYAEVDRPEHRRYSSDDRSAFDGTLYVDRPVRAPGMFESGRQYPYPYPSELHPRVSCELTMPSSGDRFSKPFDDNTYGWGRFFGTLSPYRFAVNPTMAGAFLPATGGGGTPAQRAESSGSYSKDTNVFQILYRQIDNKAPISIKLWVNDASEKTGTTAKHTYRSYTMQRRADQVNPDYRVGVWYEYKLQSGSTELPLGPHTYYFTANDGEHTVKWPVRPDLYEYNNKAVTITDWWVPTESLWADHRKPEYMDNDYVPGPFVNNAPLVTNVSVTPGTAKEGSHFVYKATYSDADGQRINGASITIETNDRGDQRTFALLPDPKYNIDPAADNRDLYKAGVEFTLDTATIDDFVLDKGVRRFYVEFTDDWGRQNSVNDMRKGETTRYPAGDGNWVSGPVISGNTAPTLSKGRVDSVDGTANAATLWTFRANYRDLNNDAPALIKLFIGQLQPLDKTVPNPSSDVRNILWDSGHTMVPSDPSDTIYSDGADFYFQSRLGGPDVGSDGIQYYFAFEAYDGVAYATYKNSSNDNERSDAAGCFIKQDAERKDDTHYRIVPLVAKQLTIEAPTGVLDPDPLRIGDIVKVCGVYTDENLSGTNYYPTPTDYTTGAITLSATIPAGRVWVVVEADTPIVGPLPIEQPTPAGVIADVEVFQNASSDNTPLFITDQKNGFISETDPAARAVVLQNGVAARDGKPSAYYAAPDNAKTIASVEGVYWLNDPNAARKFDNYYDPLALVPPVVREGSVTSVDGKDADGNPITQYYAGLPDPDEVYKVLGVYDNPDLIGTNYYPGAGYPNGFKWQEAFVISPNVIWPKNPMDIASIQGVYLSLNEKDPAGSYIPANSGLYVLPATFDAGTGDITIDAALRASDAVSRILRVNANEDMSGDDYYVSADPAGDPYTGDAIQGNTVNAPTGPLVWVSYVPAVNFGPDQEFVALKRTIVSSNLPEKVFVAYYQPGDMDPNNALALSVPFTVAGAPAYFKIWPKAFNAGDKTVRLTKRLPDLDTDATFVNTGTIKPANPAVLPDIGEVTGVFIEGDPTNYYKDTMNPFKAGDTVVRLGAAMPNPPGGPIKIAYIPKQRSLTIKYSDIRYTHTAPGFATQVTRVTAQAPASSDKPWTYTYTQAAGKEFFMRDGSVGITGNTLDALGNPRDVDGGVVGVWLSPDLSGPNYFNPRRVNPFLDDMARLRLSTQAPTGTNMLYGRVYQKGDYFINRWDRKNRELRFATDHNVGALDRIQVSYFFGTKMPKLLVPNTLPALAEGKVTPITGSRNTQYVYSVKYTDIDGPNGQMPAYVRVYIDGVPYNMTSVTQGTPVYKTGAYFTFTPSGGLVGGSHTYHFEASDGAAIAWFDKNGAHQTERGLSSLDVLDLDGPWVNDPPLLANGSVSPNPVPGGIGTRDSVDYTLNLRDLDNDPPYVYDTLRDTIGKDVTGSPRLWVDAGTNDDAAVPMIGKIYALQSDPLEMSKKRVIIAKIDDGAGNLVDPNWTPDQFAGKLMQVSNGEAWSDVFPSPYLSVYLIQSNTANTLTIATDTLDNSQLLVPDDPSLGTKRYVEFRVNGLLMSKLDPTQENYALGVDYKVTVPRLAVGSHKFHFTARTRETKPLWLLDMASYTNKVPYSVAARFPAVGDLIGPNVISVTPTGNQAPVLAKIGSSSLYRGPRAQRATIESLTGARPSNYNVLLSVIGVHRSANFDAHLPEAQRHDFFDPNIGVNPPATGDLVRLMGLVAVPDTAELVQLRQFVAGEPAPSDDLLTITPEAPAAIGTVLAVYLAKDPALATPYAVSSPTLVGGKVKLAAPLPVGTKDVYIKYTPATATMTAKAVTDPDTGNDSDWLPLANPATIAYVVGVYTAVDTDMANNLADVATWIPGDARVSLLATVPAGTDLVVKYVPWPPVYLKHFALEPTSATPPIHGIFTAGEPLTFKVTYRDANGDPPTYHDGVQGYVKIVFNDINRTSQLVPVGPTVDYTAGVVFGVTLTDVPEGTHPYHFEASDGYVVTRFPADQSGSGANDEKVQVNYKPSLKLGSVDHYSGATTFAFSVTYTDKDNVAPITGGYVQVVLTKQGDATKTATINMTTTDVAPSYSSGVRYSGVASAKDADGDVILPAGVYDAVFTAHDGVQSADPLGGTSINVRDTNAAPVIVEYDVKKLQPNGQLGNDAGKTTDTFVYRAWYRDADNDAPVAVFAGVRQQVLTLIIDKDQASEQRVPMTMVPLPQNPPPAPPSLPDYTLATGVEYQAKVTGKKLGVGNHTYTVSANDGTTQSVFNDSPVVAPSKNGPILMIPFFLIEVSGKDGEPITDRSIVGQEVLLKGKMYFPFVDKNQPPSAINNITFQVAKPDGTTVALNASLANVAGIPTDAPTNWVGDIVVKYSGYVDPALVTGQSLTLTASGQWTINAIWPGDSQYDAVQTDAVVDGRNDQVKITVSGPSRTLAVVDPLNPATSTPVPDMITPPMMIGSTSPGGIFGFDRALALKVVKWVPSSGQYFWYDVGGVFPALKPGDAVWIKPSLGNTQVPGSGYPAAESLGTSYTTLVVPTSTTVVPAPAMASHISGVYLNSAKTGASYYQHGVAAIPFKSGDTQIVLTSSLPDGTAQVWVDYVGSQSGVDEGWIALDNPLIQKALVGADPRYMHSKYRLVKVLAQAYPMQTSASGSPVLDPATQLPLLKPCTISLSPGWNQIGNIFFNWKKAWQAGTPAPDNLPPPAPGGSSAQVRASAIDPWAVVPVQSSAIGKVLGVYLDQSLTGNNYYQPGLLGVSGQPYKRGDAKIHLTQALPGSPATVYIKYEAYPREDVGLPIGEVHVIRLGVRKTLAEAKTAGWLTDYAWRYDTAQRDYVRVSDTAAGAERVLKAWSGYWIRCYVDCQFEIDPNTTFNGTFGTSASSAVAASEELEMPPPAPN